MLSSLLLFLLSEVYYGYEVAAGCGCWLWLLAVGCPGLAWSMVRVTKSCSTNSSTEDLVMRKFCKCVGILWTYLALRVVLQTDRLQTRGSRQRAKKGRG